MASIYQNQDGGAWSVQFYLSNGKRKKLGLKTRQKRDAQRMADKIQGLVDQKKLGFTNVETQNWLLELSRADAELYDKLAAMELAPVREQRRKLSDLFRKHQQRSDVTPETKSNWAKAEENLLHFFGDRDLEDITQEDAEAFAHWLATEPLHQRRRVKTQYSPATVGKRINFAKQFFTYAEKLGWLRQSPFRFQQGRNVTNPARWHYVPLETMRRVLSECGSAWWRAIFAFGRLGGVRGSSELYRMTWEDIHWSTADQPGRFFIHAGKTKRHGRIGRWVPLDPLLERCLAELFETAAEGEPNIFPGMKKKMNFVTMLTKTILAAGESPWVTPWYNLRKSFCSDLLEKVTDPVVYETICDHSYKMAMQHYQIPHDERLRRGHNALFVGNSEKISDNHSETAMLSNPVSPSSSVGLNRGLSVGLNRGLHGNEPSVTEMHPGEEYPAKHGTKHEKRDNVSNNAVPGLRRRQG